MIPIRNRRDLESADAASSIPAPVLAHITTAFNELQEASDQPEGLEFCLDSGHFVYLDPNQSDVRSIVLQDQGMWFEHGERIPLHNGIFLYRLTCMLDNDFIMTYWVTDDHESDLSAWLDDLVGTESTAEAIATTPQLVGPAGTKIERFWSLHVISDSDEPGTSVMAGIRHAAYDGVLLALIPDGEVGEPGWYGTPQTADKRPTRPVLLFFKGEPPGAAEALDFAITHLDDFTTMDTDDVKISSPATDMPLESVRTLPTSLEYPPYPWEEEAKLGLEMGQYYDWVELESWVEPSANRAGSLTFRFSRV